jgi:hypothetical protein
LSAVRSDYHESSCRGPENEEHLASLERGVFLPRGREQREIWLPALGQSPSGEHAMKKKQRTSRTKALSAAELDARHDAGVDLSAHMDLTKAARPGRAVQRVNVDFPVDLLREIDQEARRLGVTRQAFIKVRLADSLVKSH